MACRNGLMVRAKAQRFAKFTIQPNGAIAENGTYIPEGVQSVDSGVSLMSCFPFLTVANSYPPIGTPCYVKNSLKYGNFVPKYGTGTTARVLASSWNAAVLGYTPAATSTDENYIPKDLAAKMCHYTADIPAIAVSAYVTVSVPTPAGVYVTGLTVEVYGTGTWWTGEAIIKAADKYAPTTGALNVGIFMPDAFSCAANTLRLHLWGFKTDSPLTLIEVPNPACNEGARTYANWTKPANFQMIGAFQVGVNSGNWFPMCWGIAGNNGGTGFSWQRTTSNVTNSVVFAQAKAMGQASVNNRAAGHVKVCVVGVQF